MEVRDSFDAFVVSFGVLVQIPYAVGDGLFVYPTIALIFAVGSQVLSWAGTRSVVVIGIVCAAILLAAAIRLVTRRRPLVSFAVPGPARPMIVTMVSAGVAFLPGIVVLWQGSR
jgi:hypothetical protein